jgi:hypothetical protein
MVVRREFAYLGLTADQTSVFDCWHAHAREPRSLDTVRTAARRFKPRARCSGPRRHGLEIPMRATSTYACAS